MVLVAVAVAAVALIAAADRGEARGTGGRGVALPPPLANNPCLTEAAERLLCPDLRIAAPSDLYIDTAIRPGKRLLRATNNIRSRGLGPAELRGIKSPPGTMRANQGIYKRGGGRLVIRTQARLDFYPIPGQYRYWKMRDAAAFEIWAVNNEGTPTSASASAPSFTTACATSPTPGPAAARRPAPSIRPAARSRAAAASSSAPRSAGQTSTRRPTTRTGST